MVQDMTLTAFYSINEGTEIVIVAFNEDNGTGVKTVDVAKGTQISEPPIPEKAGYIFGGWYLENEKFNFSTKISENIVLVAKWSVDENYSEDKDNGKNSESGKTTNGSGISSGDINSSSSVNLDSSDGSIKYSSVEGIWYAEGTEFYNDNGTFYSENIKLDGKKLIYTVNNTKTVFYREKDYPKATEWPHETLVRQLDGYYWYLDGYKYTYLHPTVIPWYDHKCLSWESQNICVTSDKLVAYENFEQASYESYRNNGASSTTHNTLMANPVEYADSLIEKYGMQVKSNKLYMTVGGKEYSFTRYDKEKPIEVSLEVENTNITMKDGETTHVKVKVSPWWTNYLVEVLCSGDVSNGICEETRKKGEDCFKIIALEQGRGYITLKEKYSGATKKIEVTVKPLEVSGISLNKSSMELTKGSEETLKATTSTVTISY